MILENKQFICINSKCAAHFPIVAGIPVLLNDKLSIFSIDDFVSYKKPFAVGIGENIKKIIRFFIPTISRNIKADENYSRLINLLQKQSITPRILVIGGGTLGQGMETLVNNKSLVLVESDVSFGPRTGLICDAHNIPFMNESFDCVIAQAVLEHVVDPNRCVEEIHRVLNENGLVYAETPFMQQVHCAPYDFTRFTFLGHRRLFRRFEEIDSGAGSGPGMALAWSYQSFLLSFTASRIMIKLVGIFARLTSFYFKYFDYYLINKPKTLDYASGLYFMGRKGKQILSDRDLIKLYKGSCQ